MNRKLLACVMVVLATGSACAADGQKARQAFRQMDQNGDRALQFTEIQAARAALFDRLDANRNGVVDNSEAQDALQRVREGGRLQMVTAEGLETQARRMDANGDGRITRAEVAQFIPDRLLRADNNGDRALSLAELKALRQR
ncbi:EF-hand domain-containing protein [Sinorhizobium medicae]|uniref:EF-hand domain-containing protein n=1 Tax=Sinorhizobium medicae TaxID=110321 RepID=UPI0004162C6D|nr:EF-hand domain-containing protein [Sinorhizobium medicae]MBO1959809.1 EF-hand domain-containing protein [Sinorhizobium medicae]WQO61724.1 EF-hand domain-containing protein [Sinorhizobium medicae]WQP40668.1 EF-hand domain-containing protein [Sinorhizobium medicae]